jgi:hypothetical protein
MIMTMIERLFSMILFFIGAGLIWGATNNFPLAFGILIICLGIAVTVGIGVKEVREYIDKKGI